MATRKLPTSLSTPPVAGPDYMDAVASKVGMLFDAASLKPTAVSNSGNDYTITVDPVLDADVVASMSFYIGPNASNTGPCRLRVTNSNPYYDLVKATGEALGPGDFATGTAYLVVFMGGEFRILSVANSESGDGASTYFQEFLVSGTWAKPANLDPNAILMVEVWGGGGGGANGSNSRGGGGGGAYNFDFLKASDLTSSVSVTVGAGGAAGGNIGVAGGNSSFGSYVTAFGGGAGNSTLTGSGGGGGGGATSAGANATTSAGGNGGDGAITTDNLIAAPGLGSGTNGSGRYGGGGGGGAAGGGKGGDAIWGGGGGGANGVASSAASVGGSSVYGGGGGTGGTSGSTAGGVSLYGGNGGARGAAGSVPGGGGGASGTGAAGKVIVRVVG
ncbi:hypothetical protein CO731_04942 [Aminobacter sp. MSH1]|nr:hypothetical protein CO731_04942 [Aminobacter sp. MSH1]